jgi:transcriptional regulator with XRE-family HTH domain
MNTKRGSSAYEKLSKKFGKPTFASHLKAIVELDFESRSACARKLGITPQALYEYTSANRIPSPSQAGKMAKKLGYSPIVFIELAVSDSIQKAGYKYKVKLESA